MQKHVRLSGSGPEQVTISGLEPEEKELVAASLDAGTRWIRNKGGRLDAISVFEEFPHPIKDKDMYPFWRAPNEEEKRLATCQPTLLALDELEDHSSPSIHISSLCGYDYSTENYEAEAENLRSYGFEIMRSPRGKDGKYWETWYLPGLWYAKGDLKDAIDNSKNSGNNQTEKEKLSVALDFIRYHVKFGTLHVCVQRLAMVMRD